MAKKNDVIIPEEILMNKIYLIRDQKVMLDSDLAQLYGVETKYLKRQVNRNMDRFPEDFMFEFTNEEFEVLRCQIGTSKETRGGARYTPMAFTEQGVAMLSSVLNSPKAIQINIRIMRIFTKMRKLISDNVEIMKFIQALEQKTNGNTKSIELLFEYMDEMMIKSAHDEAAADGKRENPKRRKAIGFKTNKK